LWPARHNGRGSKIGTLSLGERPISNWLGLLETHDLRVFSLSENTASVNAFSFWRQPEGLEAHP
jgi:hypothetical protein